MVSVVSGVLGHIVVTMGNFTIGRHLFYGLDRHSFKGVFFNGRVGRQVFCVNSYFCGTGIDRVDIRAVAPWGDLVVTPGFF